MKGRKEGTKWTDTLKNELEKSPLASNLFFGLILALLEKLVELEFVCPCASGWNTAFACLFLIPGILGSVLMRRIKGCKCDKRALLCCVPLIVWLTFIFLDGQYLACAVTNWSGSYETVNKSVNIKWCNPHDNSSGPPEELLRWTHYCFCISQVIGMGFVVILTVVTGVYPKNEESSKQNNQYQQPMEMSAVVEDT